MSTKEIVRDLLERLPDDVSLRDVAREIEFVAAVRAGFASHEREGGVTLDEARLQLSSGVKSATR